MPGEDLTGDDLELARKAAWAIEQVTEAMGGPLRLQQRDSPRDGADQRGLASARLRRARHAALRARDGPPRCCSPSRPTPASDAYERLTGQRVWDEPWPAPEPALLEARDLRARLPGQRQGFATAWRPRRAPARDELVELCLAAPNVRAHVDGKDIVKRIVVPGKLVNVVAR